MNYPPHLTPARVKYLDGLSPDFSGGVIEVLVRSAEKGARMVPYFGIRDARTQACFWRQSRTTPEIQRRCAALDRHGAPLIAELIRLVGPQSGRWVTNAIPGESFHQYGLAVDCFLLNENGEAIWDGQAKGYEVYAKAAEKAGLTAGIHFNDPVHIEAAIRPFDPKHPATIQSALESEGML